MHSRNEQIIQSSSLYLSCLNWEGRRFLAREIPGDGDSWRGRFLTKMEGEIPGQTGSENPVRLGLQGQPTPK